jgi:hypothetical protein
LALDRYRSITSSAGSQNEDKPVKKVLTIVLAWTSLVFMLTFVAAGSFKTEPKNEPTTEANALPAYKIFATLASMGLNPIGEPARRGPYYVMHAQDRRGTELRVVADAQFGDILSVAPAQNAETQLYQRGPHIIQVPQADMRADTRASVNDRDEPDANNDNDDQEVDAAPPPSRRVAPAPRRQDDMPLRPRAPRWQPRSETPPQPAAPRRAVLSAPTQAQGPTPIRPIPRNNSKAEPAVKFGPPRDVRSSAPPPAGYAQPAESPNGG